MESYTKNSLVKSEDLYSTNHKLKSLFPDCAKPSEHKNKPWITFQQIFEINLEYRLNIYRKYQQNPDLLSDFNFVHQTTHTIEIIKILAWTPFPIYSTKETLVSLLTYNIELPRQQYPDDNQSNQSNQPRTTSQPEKNFISPLYSEFSRSPFVESPFVDSPQDDFPLGQPDTPLYQQSNFTYESPSTQQVLSPLIPRSIQKPNDIISEIPDNRPTLTSAPRAPSHITINSIRQQPRIQPYKHPLQLPLPISLVKSPPPSPPPPPPPPPLISPLIPPTSQTTITQFRKQLPHIILNRHNNSQVTTTSQQFNNNKHAEIISQQYNRIPIPKNFTLNLTQSPTPTLTVPSIHEIQQSQHFSQSQSQHSFQIQPKASLQSQSTNIMPFNRTKHSKNDDLLDAFLEISDIMTYNQSHHHLQPVQTHLYQHQETYQTYSSSQQPTKRHKPNSVRSIHNA